MLHQLILPISGVGIVGVHATFASRSVRIPARWGLFSGESRDVFRAVLAVDDATWARGRGHALSQAVIFIPYYLNTNPIGVGNARCLIEEVLSDYRVRYT